MMANKAVIPAQKKETVVVAQQDTHKLRGIEGLPYVNVAAKQIDVAHRSRVRPHLQEIEITPMLGGPTSATLC